MSWMKLPTPTNCPCCQYSLRGLPAAHRCPECGFSYGHDAFVWGYGSDDTSRDQGIRGRRLRRTIWSCVTVGILAYFLTSWTYDLLWFKLWNLLGVHIALLRHCVVVIPALAVGAVLWAGRRRRAEVYLTPEGVHARRGRHLAHVRWADLLAVERDGDDLVIDVKLGSGPTLRIPGMDVDEFLSFRDEIIRRRDAAGGQGGA